ncbi:pirin-like C-terminal cupin domain-containing protein [Congregibacter variabilis]|uniref:Pirin-like C-terminal cupin domain-containing protein n=1 Tax=Congregibacter variabilis TaxID=3081200 RepID=A0ABZ0I038_9GAMM|nr:pirin-like C-terminal cupin domain-containing protein [Congregibacter sp. IMCC43200]
MNAKVSIASPVPHQPTVISDPVDPGQLRIGSGFEALTFRHEDFDGLMDPLIMVDHFTMAAPTFGPHGHAGISAVSVLFEDSEGVFNNRDSLGNDIDLMPGDLYWLKAGRGGMHDEKPAPGGRTHGLQMFVNLPAANKYDDPRTLHVKAAQIPTVESERYRVRVVLGESNGVRGASSPALPLTILDAQLRAGGTYSHSVAAGNSAWVHSVSGDSELVIDDQRVSLQQGQAISLRSGGDEVQLKLHSQVGAKIVVVEAAPLRETFVQKGPFAMATEKDVEQIVAAYERGDFGSID